MPLFSILIPTMNRANLLKYAIQSVLQQDCDDYELIVSDNNSSDDIHRITLEFNSPKIRYINTGECLITSHDSWNFAYKHAKGDYILLLADDDYLVAGALKHVREVIRKKSALMVSWGLITYHDATYNDVSHQNIIDARTFTNKIFEVATKDVLKAYFNLDPRPAIYPPHASSVCISRFLADKIAKKYGGFYAPPLADVTAISRSLAYTDSLFVIDKPLVIIGRTYQSSVTKYRLAINLNDVWKEHEGDLATAMFKGEYLSNLHVESLRRVKCSDPERFKGYDINVTRYCCLYYEDMLNAIKRGRDPSNDLKEFFQILSSLPPNVQKDVHKYIRKARLKSSLLRSKFMNIVFIRTLAEKVYALLKRDGKSISIRGNRVGVYDIAGCADQLVKIARTIGQPEDAWDYQIPPT